ncbi:hypothetical protein [Arthrobacter sp. NIO-1057]|uniref:hypothetical protein n=1 Tax=Arthrobacter sp. NIO-1057 TaxID=993071 RepID=UPI00071C3A2A|nr:hypothetical protein [Arthrobacter sp. NIO-1057]KSU64903.1 hypothetical protein AS038_14885 [Arthrobacter sp. NIO-1057]SCC49331.1 hypothetical protein GA0061084_3041 [Arthrobacter sp. NIO-1057]
MPKPLMAALPLALCTVLALSACSSTQAEMPDDETHKIAAQGTASPSPSETSQEMTTAQVATTAGAVIAAQLGFPSSAKIQGKDLEALATAPTDTLKDIVVLPAQCSTPINDLNWSPVQMGTESARTDFTNENQTITGSVEVAKLGDDGEAALEAHNANVATILDKCQSVKLNGMDYTETLKFSDPKVEAADSSLYYSRNGDYAQNSLVLIKKTSEYAVMVSFVSATELSDTKFNEVATNVMNAAISQLP